jgi:hypothetical protein
MGHEGCERITFQFDEITGKLTLLNSKIHDPTMRQQPVFATPERVRGPVAGPLTLAIQASFRQPEPYRSSLEVIAPQAPPLPQKDPRMGHDGRHTQRHAQARPPYPSRRAWK